MPRHQNAVNLIKNNISGGYKNGKGSGKTIGRTKKARGKPGMVVDC
jgi:hypothetical protein